MKKKILVITPWYPTAAHPVEGIFVKDQAEVLAANHDVFVLSLALSDWKEFLLRTGKPVIPPPQTTSACRLEKFPTLPGARFFYPAYTRRYTKKLERLFDETVATWGVPDIIHAHIVLPTGAAALEIGKKHGIPVVLTEHTEPFSLHLRTKACQRLTRQTLLDIDRTIAVSPSLERDIKGFEPGARVEVVGNVIDDQFFSPLPSAPKEEPAFRFLTIALLSKRKGVGYLLEAAQILSKQAKRRFELVIGGDGPERYALQQQAEKSGMMSYCKFTGALNRGQVRDWINKSDVFVLPSLGETFGVVLLESMMCGKPVIATRCGGPEDLVNEQTGLLVEKANPAALAAAMEKMLEGRLSFQAEAVRQSALERYGQAAFLKKISGIYESLLPQRS